MATQLYSMGPKGKYTWKRTLYKYTPIQRENRKRLYLGNTPPLPVKHKGGSTTFEVWKEENNIELKYGP
jgi:hypothetical protein